MVFFFLIPSIPAVLGNFLVPMMIGARDLAFPRLNLASWYIFIVGALFTLWAVVTGGVDTGWTFYTPYSTARLDIEGDPGRARHLHHRLLVDPDRAQLHRHDPPHARAGPDLVPPAALRLGALRDQHHLHSRHAGDRDHHAAARRRARAPLRHLRPGARRRPGAVPAPLLVLLAPGRLHHDPARHGRDQRARHAASRARASSATASSRSRAWRSRSSASWSGATTCSSAASRSTPA